MLRPGAALSPAARGRSASPTSVSSRGLGRSPPVTPSLVWLSSSRCRSEERSVGKECVSTCRSRCSAHHSKKKVDDLLQNHSFNYRACLERRHYISKLTAHNK